MSETPDFLDLSRPDVPDIVIPRGIVPFRLPGRPVRGRLIRLGALADALLSRHENHPVVTRLAGEALALTAGLSAALKFRGSFSLQAKGDGPVRMLLSDCTEAGELRGYARADAERLGALLEQGEPTARALLGDGYLAFTVDQGEETDRHQGIVAIEGESLSDMALHYFETSEQLDCWIRLACRQTASGWRAAALVLERVASEGGLEESLTADDPTQAWHTATTLAATLRDEELLDDGLEPEALLFRLFHGEGVVADRARALAFGCRCTRARLSSILEGFAGDDLDHMNVDGSIVMTCEFCNHDFRFARETIRGAAVGEDASGHD
jgi:molecular chaperone Hsp33